MTRAYLSTIVPIVFPYHVLSIEPVPVMPQDETNDVVHKEDTVLTITRLLDHLQDRIDRRSAELSRDVRDLTDARVIMQKAQEAVQAIPEVAFQQTKTVDVLTENIAFLQH